MSRSSHPNLSRNRKRDSYRESRESWVVKEKWIKEAIDSDGIRFTEDFGRKIANSGLSTSQIRNYFGEVRRIQMKGYEREKMAFLLLKPKLAYAAKRNKNEGANAFRKVMDQAHSYVENESDFQNFVNLLEAILAYHKANDGKI
ncbi:MAG: type III-A CRISPR-associated protein Csm2 [Bacteroidota bacterium]